MISTWHNHNNLTLRAPSRIGWYGLKFPRPTLIEPFFSMRPSWTCSCGKPLAAARKWPFSPTRNPRWGAA